MNRNIYQLLLAASLICFAVSCATFDIPDDVKFDDPSIFQPDSSWTDDLSKGIPDNPVMDAIELETKSTSTDLTSAVFHILGDVSSSKVHSITGTYWSVDKKGNPLRLSGKIMLPASGKVKNYILLSHFTVTSNYQCPSMSFQLEGLLALDGYALIISDYIGYGVTVDMVHPYLCANLTAQNVVDMLEASVPYLEKIGIEPEDKSIILMGYSQGGATTMAVQRLLERDYSDKYKIKRNYAGAGPYDIATTYDYLIDKNETSIPCAMPMIIMGMDEGESLGLEFKDFFKEPLLSHTDEWINSKKYTNKQINRLMGTRLLSDILTDEAREKRSSMTVRLYTAMLRNSVVNGWSPKAPVYMFHSMDDDTVPYINTQVAKNQFSACNIEYNIGHYGKHGMGCVFFVGCVHQLLKK